MICMGGQRACAQRLEKERGAGNHESNYRLEKKFLEGEQLEKELVKARLGLDSILLKTQKYTKGL